MRLNEIYPGLIASDFLVTEEDSYSWQVWLWDSVESYARWQRIHRGVSDYECLEDAAAHNGMPIEIGQPYQLVGHLHFLRQSWDEETVAHEMLHAFIHYARSQIPDLAKIFYLGPMIREEESCCYPFGRWFSWVWRWLWKVDPPGPVTKETV